MATNDNQASQKNSESENDNVQEIKYSTIKRMLATLEKFLSKRMFLLLGLCILAVSACGIGLIVNDSILSRAAETSGGNNGRATLDASAWLWSGVVIFSFFSLILVVYWIAKKKHKASL